VLDTSEKETYVSVSDCWKSYNLADFIVNTNECLRDVKSSNLKDWWKKPWFEAVSDFRGFPTQQEEKETSGWHVSFQQKDSKTGRKLTARTFSNLTQLS
jgi:hypothetical protein